MKAILITVSLLIVVVNSHPICTSVTDQGNENVSVTHQGCTDNITTNVMFLDKWLNLSDSSKGIDQLRRRSRNSVANKLLNSTSTPVSHLFTTPHTFYQLKFCLV